MVLEPEFEAFERLVITVIWMVNPQCEHRRDVFAGSICSTVMPWVSPSIFHNRRWAMALNGIPYRPDRRLASRQNCLW